MDETERIQYLRSTKNSKQYFTRNPRLMVILHDSKVIS